jgi:hypothetical protein
VLSLRTVLLLKGQREKEKGAKDKGERLEAGGEHIVICGEC